jgi:hypothetical protein
VSKLRHLLLKWIIGDRNDGHGGAISELSFLTITRSELLARKRNDPPDVNPLTATRVGVRDLSDHAYSVLARSLRVRWENIRTTVAALVALVQGTPKAARVSRASRWSMVTLRPSSRWFQYHLKPGWQATKPDHIRSIESEPLRLHRTLNWPSTVATVQNSHLKGPLPSFTGPRVRHSK